jgi:hypothetical protein
VTKKHDSEDDPTCKAKKLERHKNEVVQSATNLYTYKKIILE